MFSELRLQHCLAHYADCKVLLNLVTAIICNEAFETSKADEADLAKQPLASTLRIPKLTCGQGGSGAPGPVRLKLQKEQEMREFKDRR